MIGGYGMSRVKGGVSACGFGTRLKFTLFSHK
uniref:Uncharacterized protein n=1 Tax=Solanum lycopersicum TaxID=4081 RepID=A0A3Q7HND9_SOLLC